MGNFYTSMAVYSGMFCLFLTQAMAASSEESKQWTLHPAHSIQQNLGCFSEALQKQGIVPPNQKVGKQCIEWMIKNLPHNNEELSLKIRISKNAFYDVWFYMDPSDAKTKSLLQKSPIIETGGMHYFLTVYPQTSRLGSLAPELTIAYSHEEYESDDSDEDD